MENAARAEFIKIILDEVLPAIAKAYCTVGRNKQEFAFLWQGKDRINAEVRDNTKYLHILLNKYIDQQETFLIESFNEILDSRGQQDRR